MQTNLQPRRAVGFCRGLAIAQNAKFCRGMKRACLAARGAVTDGVLLECPLPLDEDFESVVFGGFSKGRTIFLGGNWPDLVRG